MAYRTIPGLKEYLLVYQDRKQLELFRKSATGEWLSEIYKDCSSVRLNAIPRQVIEISLDQIYWKLEIKE